MTGYIRYDVKALLDIYYDIWLAPGIDFDYIEARPSINWSAEALADWDARFPRGQA